MPTFLSAAQAAHLRRIARPFKKKVKLGKPFRRWTDDDLWLKVLGQIAVVGKAKPGERLQHDLEVKRRVSIRRLKKIPTDARLQKHLHGVFQKLDVRYVGSNWRNDRKAAAAVKNFRKLMAKGGPKKFFQQIAECKTEEERIETLQKELQYYGEKGARDTLIELRLAKDCMALDARIYGVLKKVGVKVSQKEIFSQIEKELIRKVATPLKISGAMLDRTLFQNYSQILEER